MPRRLVRASGAEGALVESPGIVELSHAIEDLATRWGPGVALQFHAGCGDESLRVQLLRQPKARVPGLTACDTQKHRGSDLGSSS
jgi:hypothetical protein